MRGKELYCDVSHWKLYVLHLHSQSGRWQRRCRHGATLHTEAEINRISFISAVITSTLCSLEFQHTVFSSIKC